MKRIRVIANETEAVLFTTYVKEEDVQERRDSITANPQYGIELNDYMFEITEMTTEQAKAEVYLHRTDWYATRQEDSGKPIPEEIVTARATAREVL